MDLRNLDLKVEPMSFDGVILSNVLDVMPKDISTIVIDDLERVLKIRSKKPDTERECPASFTRCARRRILQIDISFWAATRGRFPRRQ